LLIGPLVKHVGKCFDLAPMINLGRIEFVFEVVESLRIRP
jgi:hypothetical protein